MTVGAASSGDQQINYSSTYYWLSVVIIICVKSAPATPAIRLIPDNLGGFFFLVELWVSLLQNVKALCLIIWTIGSIPSAFIMHLD